MNQCVNDRRISLANYQYALGLTQRVPVEHAVPISHGPGENTVRQVLFGGMVAEPGAAGNSFKAGPAAAT